jgi:outer membrane receptor protein involved in Fe transport
LPPDVDKIRLDHKHWNIYTYANFNLLHNLTLTGGLSFDYLTGTRAAIRDGQDHQFNPKLGISWTPFNGTSLRAAVTRAFKRTLINDATLEPTQVAGLNQFFDDLDGTKAWRYGIALDQKITQNVFTGMELSLRDLTMSEITGPSAIRTVDGKEYLVRNYVFWVPHQWLALTSEYIFERFDKSPNAFEDFRVSTHRVPLGIKIFHPSGWSGSFTTTYYHQSGNFLRGGSFQPASSDFLTFDAGISYRLPNRFGLITIGASNLSAEKFEYFDTDRDNPRIQPKRMIFLKATLALP